jgi:hypothetical protein
VTRRSRWLCVPFAALTLSLVFGATLLPSPGPDSRTLQWCLLCGDFGLSDAIANVVLFAPVGISLCCAGLSSRRAIAIGLLLSCAIEFTQLRFVPGREAAVGDVLWNTVGTALGAGLVRWLPEHGRSGPRAFAAAAAALAVIVAVGLLQRPSFPPTVYYGQWTADLGMYEWYRGQVLAADIGDMPLRSWRLQDSRTVRERLRAGVPLRVRAVAGPRTGRLAPLFSIADDQQRGILLIGPDRDDLVLQVSTWATDFRLHQPDLRWRGAMASVAPGDTLAVEVSRARRGYCLRLNGRQQCDLAHTAGRAWGLVDFVPHLPPAAQTLLDCVFMAILGLPVGLLLRRSKSGYAAAWFLLLGALVLPPLVGLAPTPLPQVAALAAGIVAAALAP